MKLTRMIDINEMLKLTQGQGHKVKGQGQICNYTKKIFGYKSLTADCILLIIEHMIDINK